MSAGGDFACAAGLDGTVGCFLAEPEGLPPQVVAAAWAAPRERAAAMPGVNRASLVAAGVGRNVFGNGYACALREDGTMTCWSDDDFGQLGDGRRSVSSPPVEVRAPVP